MGNEQLFSANQVKLVRTAKQDLPWIWLHQCACHRFRCIWLGNRSFKIIIRNISSHYVEGIKIIALFYPYFKHSSWGIMLERNFTLFNKTFTIKIVKLNWTGELHWWHWVACQEKQASHGTVKCTVGSCILHSTMVPMRITS